LNQSFRRCIAHTGATPDQFTALRTLSEASSPFTQSDLTRAMSSDPNTIASLLERMEKTGWIERHAHESDRRARLILLKPAGKQKYAELRAIAVALQTRLLSALPAREREKFLEQLASVAATCADVATETRHNSRS
jgi:DNA-binding MarR family transcriptional regulator